MWCFFKNPQGLAAKGKILMFMHSFWLLGPPTTPMDVYTNMYIYIYINMWKCNFCVHPYCILKKKVAIWLFHQTCKKDDITSQNMHTFKGTARNLWDK